MTSFAESWICISCGTTNNRNRNGNPCTNCHILESDTNLKRARELYILGNIKSESVRLLPLKTPFFIYPLSAPEVQYHVEYKEDYEMLIHFEVELWDERRIEFYHIEAIKIDVESRSEASTIIQNTTPYNNAFVFHHKQLTSSTGSYTFDIYAKCYHSTRVSPKQPVTILISSPSIADTHSKTTCNAIILHSKSTHTRTDNTKQIIWYFMNDAGKRMATYDGLSKIINGMTIETEMRVKYRSNTYSIRKITSTECIQRNIKTNKVRQLTTARYKANNHDDDRKDANECQILNIITGKATAKQMNNHDDYKADHGDQSNTFVPRHLTYQEATQLKNRQLVDIRCNSSGFVYKGTVVNSSIIVDLEGGEDTGTHITIGFKGSEEVINIDKTYHNELHRLAQYKSISTRIRHRFTKVKYIDINPIYVDPGWKPATIIDSICGQIEVVFRHSVSDELIKYWVHPDNTNECADFGTGCIDLEQIKALFHSTVSPTKYEVIEIKDVSKSNAIHRNLYESILKSKEKPLHELEKYLWHGTNGSANDDVLDLILKNGFDRS
eukprot:313022_1